MKSQDAAKFAVNFLLFIGTAPCYSVPHEPRLFTPRDDVELALFEYAGQRPTGGVIKYSPNGRYFAVVTERGRPELNAPEDTIWLFRTEEVRRFVEHPSSGAAPDPLPLVTMATDKDGPLIEGVRWLPDSSGIAFTGVKNGSRSKFHQLFVADVRTHALNSLTPEDEDIGEFDILSATRYVYEVNPPKLLNAPSEAPPSMVALTGQSLWTVLFPSAERRLSPFTESGLWTVMGGNRRHVLDAKSYEPSRGGGGLAISPDGRSVVAIQKTDHPPESWTRYKAPPGYDKFTLDTSAYYLIDLTSGAKRLLVNAASGMSKYWNSQFSTARWAADGQSLLLPNTFLPLDATDPREIAARKDHPYAVVLQLRTGELSPVMIIKAGLDKERYAIDDARFEDNQTIVVDFDRSHFLPLQPASAVFRNKASGSWQPVAGAEDPRLAALSIKVRKRESINQPPVLIAEDTSGGNAHTIWNPNPQLKDVELGSAEIIHWRDKNGHEWKAGLVKPPNYSPGKRYPVVVQTHGLSKEQFLSNGVFTSAFAARAIAARGIVVLQIDWNPNNFDTRKEGPDQLVGFESAVKKLAEEGMIDPTRVGAIGFSRSVYHVLYAMTASRKLFAAASVTDGITFGYFEYLFAVDSGLSDEADPLNGGRPFGTQGLESWLKRSPEFNMDKVQTPLLLLQPGAQAVFEDWEPYAALRYLNKPVDLIMLQLGTHVMTNPTQRIASETTNVDWFRFWLQDYEDPDPAKAEQYQRWRELRKLQEAEDVERANAGKESSKAH